MNYLEIRKIVDTFLEDVQNEGKEINTYEPIDVFNTNTYHNIISIQLDGYKEIVLDNETALELGGMNKKSFSLIYPIEPPKKEATTNLVHIIGPEIKEFQATEISFSLFILLTINELTNEIYEELRNLAFISNGIEGFTIRSIPRRFWCRISKDVIKKGFSFQLLGNAIVSLYRKKFRENIHSIEILMINSSPELIDKWSESTAEMRADLNARWRAKVDTWKKRIDCDYEWTCKICPYFISCKKLQKLLERRKNLEI